MTAKQLVKKMGSKLIGKWVQTVRYGEWPGGPARVFALSMDRKAPEIVCQVSQGTKTIGVFDHEPVALIEGPEAPLNWRQQLAEDLWLICGALPDKGPARQAFSRIDRRLRESELED